MKDIENTDSDLSLSFGNFAKDVLLKLTDQVERIMPKANKYIYKFNDAVKKIA